MSKHNISSLTVKELRDLLSGYSDDLPVVFGYNYGDHWDTKVLGEICDAEEGLAEWSGYHSMFKTSDEEDPYTEDGELDEEKYTEVLILN